MCALLSESERSLSLQAEEMQDAAAAPEKLDPADAAAETEVTDVAAMDVDAVVESPGKPDDPKADAAVSAEPLQNGFASTAAETEAETADEKQQESRDKGKDSEKDKPKVRALLGPHTLFGRGQNKETFDSLARQ